MVIDVPPVLMRATRRAGVLGPQRGEAEEEEEVSEEKRRTFYCDSGRMIPAPSHPISPLECVVSLIFLSSISRVSSCRGCFCLFIFLLTTPSCTFKTLLCFEAFLNFHTERYEFSLGGFCIYPQELTAAFGLMLLSSLFFLGGGAVFTVSVFGWCRFHLP